MPYLFCTFFIGSDINSKVWKLKENKVLGQINTVFPPLPHSENTVSLNQTDMQVMEQRVSQFQYVFTLNFRTSTVRFHFVFFPILNSNSCQSYWTKSCNLFFLSDFSSCDAPVAFPSKPTF
jgi:hypothetical protein